MIVRVVVFYCFWRLYLYIYHHYIQWLRYLVRWSVLLSGILTRALTNISSWLSVPYLAYALYNLVITTANDTQKNTTQVAVVATTSVLKSAKPTQIEMDDA